MSPRKLKKVAQAERKWIDHLWEWFSWSLPARYLAAVGQPRRVSWVPGSSPVLTPIPRSQSQGRAGAWGSLQDRAVRHGTNGQCDVLHSVYKGVPVRHGNGQVSQAGLWLSGALSGACPILLLTKSQVICCHGGNVPPSMVSLAYLLARRDSSHEEEEQQQE